MDLPEQLNRSRDTPKNRHPLLALLCLILPILLLAGALLGDATNRLLGTQTTTFSITTWFDPQFFIYHVVMMLYCILIIPIITYCYVTMMKGEKLRRLNEDLSPVEWEAYRHYIVKHVGERYRMRRYFGSVTALMIFVLLGFMSLLLFKPVPSAEAGHGMNMGLGMNFLLLGPYMNVFFSGNENDWFQRMVISAGAFQFGFLGGYIYFLRHLTRSYYTLDLTPHTFVGGLVRIGTSSSLSLVLSFLIFPPSTKIIHFLPALSFLIGYFPERGLLFLEQWGSHILKLPAAGYSAIPLDHARRDELRA